MPSVATTTWYLVPSLPRSVGLRPVSSPPRLALTEQLSTTTSHAATSGPERTIRSRATWTRRSTAVALQSLRRRRKVEPQARPAVARSSRHCTPSRTKNRSVSTTLMVGLGGRPVPSGRSSIWSMIPATNAAALDAMSASRCQKHGKRTRGQPDAQRLTIVQGSANRLLVVHPLNQCKFWDGRDPEAARLPMTPSTTPDEWMPVIVPVGRGPCDGLLGLGPGLEAASFQSQRAQRLPPRFDQVQVRRVGGLEHELPARMQQAEQQHVGSAVDVEVVEHGVDPLDGRIDPALDRAQEIDPVDRGATLISQREGRAGGRLQGAEDVTSDTTPAVVDLLLGSFRGGAGWPHQPSARIALAGLRTHLIQADNYAARRCFGVKLLDRPLLRANSGSTRAPNQVSSCRHLRPSWMKISLIRLRRMATPCWLR